MCDTMHDNWATIPTFNAPGKEAFKNIVGNGENAGNQHFLLFPECSVHNQEHRSSSELHLKCRLQMLSDLTGLKFCHLVKS